VCERMRARVRALNFFADKRQRSYTETQGSFSEAQGTFAETQGSFTEERQDPFAEICGSFTVFGGRNTGLFCRNIGGNTGFFCGKTELFDTAPAPHCFLPNCMTLLRKKHRALLPKHMGFSRKYRALLRKHRAL